MTKFIRLIDGTISNAGGFGLKLNEINIAEVWNPNALDFAEIGESVITKNNALNYQYKEEDKLIENK